MVLMNYNNTFSISLDIGKVRDIKGYQSSPARSFHPDPGFLLFVPSFSFLFWSFMSPFLSLSLLGSFPSLSNIVFSCSSQFCCLCCYLFLVNSSFSLFLLKSWYFLDLNLSSCVQSSLLHWWTSLVDVSHVSDQLVCCIVSTEGLNVPFASVFLTPCLDPCGAPFPR